MCRTLIAVAVPLLMASEAAAQASAESKDGEAAGGVQPVAGPRSSGPAAPDALFIPVPAFDEERFAEARGRVVGSVPIADNLDLQIGLLKVSRSRRGERPPGQMLRDAGSQSRIAAAGFRFSF